MSSCAACTIEINPGTSEVSDVVEYRIQAGAMDSLEAIWDELGW